MARVQYAMPAPPPIVDVGSLARQRVVEAGSMIVPGERIAVAVGSRGINRLPEIVTGLSAGLRILGVDPFIVPAMGSHGGATAEGQRAVLAHLEVTPERVGAPVLAQMETVQEGATPDGTSAHIDRLARAADGLSSLPASSRTRTSAAAMKAASPR